MLPSIYHQAYITKLISPSMYHHAYTTKLILLRMQQYTKIHHGEDDLCLTRVGSRRHGLGQSEPVVVCHLNANSLTTFGGLTHLLLVDGERWPCSEFPAPEKGQALCCMGCQNGPLLPTIDPQHLCRRREGSARVTTREAPGTQPPAITQGPSRVIPTAFLKPLPRSWSHLIKSPYQIDFAMTDFPSDRLTNDAFLVPQVRAPSHLSAASAKNASKRVI